MKNVFNGRLYIYVRGEMLENPEALSSLVKSLFPAATNGNLEMKRLRDKISRHRQALTYSLRHVVRAFSQHSGRETEVRQHTERKLLSVSSYAVSRNENFLQIYCVAQKIRAYNVI